MSILPERREPITALDVLMGVTLAAVFIALAIALSIFGCAATSTQRAKLVTTPLPARCLVVDKFYGACKPAGGGGWTCESVHLAVRDTAECKVLENTVMIVKEQK